MTKNVYLERLVDIIEAMTSIEDKIYNRIQGLKKIRNNYLEYQKDRVAEHDHHGAWDVAVNLSETECEISGLEFALILIKDNSNVFKV